MPDLSADRDSILQKLKQAEGAAEQLLGSVSRQGANWQPNQGASWSMWQCFDHLARINRAYTDALRAAAENPHNASRGSTSMVTPGWFGRWFIQKMEPPVRTRFKAPAKAIPTWGGDPLEVLKAFVESHMTVRRVLQFWDKVDFNRVRFINPFVPIIRFTVGTGLMVINAHDRRHIWQAERVKEAPGFPRE